MTRGSKYPARRLTAEPDVIVIDVRTVSPFAYNAGLTVSEAQRVLVLAPQWRYPVMLCGVECGPQPHVVVDHGWDDRDVLYCTLCKTADLWV